MIGKFSALASGVLATTELNSLANNAVASGIVYDNSISTRRDKYAYFELNVTFGTGPTADSPIELYILKAGNGVLYENGDIPPQPAMFVGSFIVKAVTTLQRLTIVPPPGWTLPPCIFKIVLYNRTGQAFPSSGSSLNIYRWNDEIS